MIRFLKSFMYGFKGIWLCLLGERNFRVHVGIAILFWYIVVQWGLGGYYPIVLVIAVFFVLVAEVFNTAIERLVDFVSPEFHRMAMIVKDLSAGAVLLSALNALAVAYYVFMKPKIYKELKSVLMTEDYITLGVMALVIIIGICLPRKKYVPVAQTEPVGKIAKTEEMKSAKKDAKTPATEPVKKIAKTEATQATKKSNNTKKK